MNNLTTQKLVQNILDKANIVRENINYSLPNDTFPFLVDKIWHNNASQTFAFLVDKIAISAPENLEELAEVETQRELLWDMEKENYTFQADKVFIYQNQHTTETGLFEIVENDIVAFFEGEFIVKKFQILSINEKYLIVKMWESANDDDSVMMFLGCE